MVLLRQASKKIFLVNSSGRSVRIIAEWSRAMEIRVAGAHRRRPMSNVLINIRDVR